MALDFENFLTEHPTCAQFYEQLENESRKLAMDAAVVPSVHGADFHAIADEIIGYVRHRYTEYAARYVARSRALEGMQAYFDKNPSVENLNGHATAVNRDDYNLALLLSIVLTNHRFEILKRLREFLSDAPLTGRLAALGTGTGYEMKLAATALPGWLLESYDMIRRRNRKLSYCWDILGSRTRSTLGENSRLMPWILPVGTAMTS